MKRWLKWVVCCYCRTDELKEKGLVYLVGIDNAKFRKTVIPGDQLKIVVDVLRYKYTICKMRGEAFVDGTLVAEAEFLTSLVNQESEHA